MAADKGISDAELAARLGGFKAEQHLELSTVLLDFG